jgi:Ca2+-binding RTX toxin-like protein
MQSTQFQGCRSPLLAESRPLWLGNDILKGNDGRDSLRGREGADAYKGGRGRDTLQTLDGIRDTLISCGDGGDDVLRKDKLDPRGRHCEHSNHKNISKAH